MTAPNADSVFAPGTIGLHGIDLSRITIWKDGDEWRVWIPPTGPESFDTDGESYLGPFGDSFWASFEDAVDFVKRAQIDESEVRQ